MPVHQWKNLERRIKIGHYKLLELLSKHKVKGTYFLLGVMAEEFPELAEIKNEGHVKLTITGFIALIKSLYK